MLNLILNAPSHGPQWVQALEAKYEDQGFFDKENWDRLLGDCQAVCDLPAALFGAELADTYPDAKVIILSRDPEKWYDSVSNSLHAEGSSTDIFKVLEMTYLRLFDPDRDVFEKTLGTMHRLATPFDHGKEKAKALKWYKSQYDEYRERIPSERRLEFSVQDGWKPLCEFLGVPVPMVEDPVTGKPVEAAFPRRNDRASLLETGKILRKKSLKRANTNLLNLAGLVSVSTAIGYGAYVVWKARAWTKVLD